jgi:hypothetical protein
VTILALEKNLWKRVAYVVRCGYSEDMNNETITYRNITITNIRRPQLPHRMERSHPPQPKHPRRHMAI